MCVYGGNKFFKLLSRNGIFYTDLISRNYEEGNGKGWGGGEGYCGSAPQSDAIVLHPGSKLIAVSYTELRKRLHIRSVWKL